MLPLLVDSILLEYDIGQILLLGFVLTTVGALPLKSQRVIGLNTVLFGLIFIMTPTSLMSNPSTYLFLGLALVVIGPIVYVTANR